MLLLLSACSSGDITVSGIDDFGPVRSATALDIVVDDLWVVGMGSLGAYGASVILLSDEAGYCDVERAWYEDHESTWEGMVAGREGDDRLCDEGPGALATMYAGDHAVPRHSAALSICADAACDWADVMPRSYDMYNPSDPYVAGSLTYTEGSVSPTAGDFDEEACHTTAAYDDRVDATYTTYDLDDGTLQIDDVVDGSTVKGSFDAILFERSEEVGTVRGTFDTDWCEVHVSTMVLL